jgi:hypothetical protein
MHENDRRSAIACDGVMHRHFSSVCADMLLPKHNAVRPMQTPSGNRHPEKQQSRHNVLALFVPSA